MKVSFCLLVVIAIISISSIGITYSTGSAINLAPADALTIIDKQVAALPVSVFRNPNAADNQKKTFSRKIDEMMRMLEDSDYFSATNNLDHEIKNHVWSWINADTQPELFENIENAIASIVNASKTTVHTIHGKVAGVDTDSGSWAWKGIPYAKPPVGELRWKAPRDPKPWAKVRFSTDKWTPSTQPEATKLWTPLNRIVGSEDCLYLNVYRPKTYTTNLPVYFWIHGGGNFMGTAKDYPGEILAAKSNMVVVVVEYRLGPLGFFAHPALNSCGTYEDRSGNYGTLDQIKALEWVRRNIAFFGGDPYNVTIAGESAGGLDVLNLMISPMARGLFHKAIIQSAATVNIPVTAGVNQANGIIDKLLVADGTCADLIKAASLRTSMSYAQIETYLREKNAVEILQVMQGGPMVMEGVFPVIDGLVIPGAVTSVFQSGNYNHVPVILGSNESEIKPFLPLAIGFMPTSSGRSWSNVYNVLGVSSSVMTLGELMPSDNDKALYEICAKYPSLYWKAAMVDSLARLLKEHRDSVYCYYFKWGGIGSGPSPFDFLFGAGHGADVAFFFGSPKDVWDTSSFTEANKEGRNALQQAMMSYTASFAVSGNPNRATSGLPVWEEWSNKKDGPKSIVFDADLTRAKIGIMNQEFSKEDVKAQINALSAPAKDVATMFLSLFE